MATNLQHIRTALQVEGVRLFSDDADTLLVTFPSRGQMTVVYIHLMEDGGYVRCHIPFFLDLSRTSHRMRVMEKLLELNYQMKLLKFGVDPKDGEVTAEIDLALEDGVATPQQMRRCMMYLTSIAMQERDRLCTLMETGVYPASDDPGFVDSLDRLLPGQDDSEDPGPMAARVATASAFEWDDAPMAAVEDNPFADE